MTRVLALGRRPPKDWVHVERYPLLLSQAGAPTSVEVTIPLPRWHHSHDQGIEGSCVGHGAAMERAITNSQQNKLFKLLRYSRRYDPLDIWNQAKIVDDWPDTNPGDDEGTSVRAAYDVLRAQGPRRIPTNGIFIAADGMPHLTHPEKEPPPDAAAGVVTNRWATTVDEMRGGLSRRLPVVIGINWYSSFDTPESHLGIPWIGRNDFGRLRGGHCVCVYGASDSRQAFKLKNSWGKAYPVVWLPYAAMQKLLDQDGEAVLVVDR